MSKRFMLIHECQDDASDMFYCYAVGGGDDPEAQDLVDWFVREDDSMASGEVNTVAAITYCPFCGTKLPDKEQDAGDTYRLVEVEEEDGGQDRRRAGGNLPIYIVRWTNPDPSICLVRANSKVDALTMMDEMADPSYCRVQEYDGPICISLDLKLKYHYEEIKVSEGIIEHHTVVDDIGEFDHEVGVDMWAEGNIEAGLDMKEALISFAFPNYASYYASYWKKSLEEDREEPTPEETAECKKAIQQDFDDIEQEFRDKFAQEELEPENPSGPLG